MRRSGAKRWRPNTSPPSNWGGRLDEGAASDARIAAGRGAIRERFDELAAGSLGELPQLASLSPSEVREVARALNLLNTAYLIDAFGREPRIDAETALTTLTTIWTGVIYGPRPEPPRD